MISCIKHGFLRLFDVLSAKENVKPGSTDNLKDRRGQTAKGYYDRQTHIDFGG